MAPASSLTSLDTHFFSYVQNRRIHSVETGDLVQALGISPIQERKLLSRLSLRGFITRVRRGLYLVPSRLPLGGRWSPGEALALTTLIEDHNNGQYQISGPNAFYRYGWDNQVPNRTYVYNNRISGERQIGPVSFTLMKVGQERLGATEVITTPDGIDLVYSSRARALMDAVYDWSRFNTLPRAYAWIEEELGRSDTLAAELIEVTVEYGNQGTLRRIGKLLESQGIQPSLLRKVKKAVRPASSIIPWIPDKPKRGKTDRSWGVVLNNE